MSASTFYRQIGLERKLSSLNKKLDKKIFYDFAELNKKEKEVTAKYIERMELAYLLTPSTINIQPFISEDFQYEGVMFISVQLREEVTEDQVKVFDEVIHGALPNPAVIVFHFKETVKISTCMKRLNKVDKSSAVLEDIHRTSWLIFDKEKQIVDDFIQSIHLTKISFVNFYEFYKDIDLAVQALQDVDIVGSYQVIQDEQLREQRQLIIQHIREFEREISQLKAAIKKETQFNKKVESNIKIQQLTKKMDQLKKQLAV